MHTYELIATAPMGLEAIVAREIRELGYTDVQIENGRVLFKGDALAICRTNLWLRTADRILIKMEEFEARTFDELFDGTFAVDWSSWIPQNAAFPVNGKSFQSDLTSVPACQKIVKKAIVEKLKQIHRTDWFIETGPTYLIEVSLHQNIATLTLDTTGPSLHKRGYRKLITEAPLKETMAAAMVYLSRWRAGRPLYDPFCGSGTIAIEAAMIGWQIAPGLRRKFACDEWPVIPQDLWHKAREEAYDAMQDHLPLEIIGSDIDPRAIEVAEAAARSAGLGKQIVFQQTPVTKAQPRGDYGVLITNPPYGERLGDQQDADIALRELSLLIRQMPSWSTFVLTPNRNFETYVGRPADKRRKLFNGRIECQLLQYFGPLPPFKE